MSEKVRNYEKESIEVCRNCKGTGIAYTVPEFHPYGREDDPQPYECPVCRGSGRVKKTLNIEILSFFHGGRLLNRSGCRMPDR